MIIIYLSIISVITYLILRKHYKSESLKNSIELDFVDWVIVNHYKSYTKKEHYSFNRSAYHPIHWENSHSTIILPETFKIAVELKHQNVLVKHKKAILDISSARYDKDFIDGSLIKIKGKIFVFNNKIVKFELRFINDEQINPIEYLF